MNSPKTSEDRFSWSVFKGSRNEIGCAITPNADAILVHDLMGRVLSRRGGECVNLRRINEKRVRIEETLGEERVTGLSNDKKRKE